MKKLAYINDIFNQELKHVYIAASIFSTAQRWLVSDIHRWFLDVGVKFFSPIHDVGVGSTLEVVSKDLRNIEEAGVLLAILDGADPNTIFKVGYARAKGIPVILVAESFSTSQLSMFVGSDCKICNSLSSGMCFAYWKLLYG